MMTYSLVAVMLASMCFLVASVAGSFDAAEAISLVQLRAAKTDPILSTAASSPNRIEPKSASPKCIVFHSQHKSAGHTVEMLAGWIPLKGNGIEQFDWKNQRTGNCKFMCDKESWDCGKQRCVLGRDVQRGGGALPEYTEWRSYYECSRNYQYMAFNGYVQTLAGLPQWGRAGEGPCVWATLSREPLARLVSALYYCKYQWATDPLCGASRLDATNATVLDFAKHWGNYLFRELLLHPDLKALAESRSDYRKDAAIDCKEEPWLQFKDQLAGGDDLRTESGRLNFQALKEHLLGINGTKPLYDAYGVVEMWDQTMNAFDKVMPLEGKTWWEAAHDAHGDHGNSWHDEEKAALVEARSDPEVLALVAADLELYNNIIVPAFQERWGHNDVASYPIAVKEELVYPPATASAGQTLVPMPVPEDEIESYAAAGGDLSNSLGSLGIDGQLDVTAGANDLAPVSVPVTEELVTPQANISVEEPL